MKKRGEAIQLEIIELEKNQKSNEKADEKKKSGKMNQDFKSNKWRANECFS